MKNINILIALILVFFAFNINAQDIPNNSFEEWENGLPKQWDGSNIEFNYEDTLLIINCVKQDENAHSGNYALMVENVVIDLFPNFVFPGLVTLGDFVYEENLVGMDVVGGIPFSHRPDSAVCYYKSEMVEEDRGLLIGIFTKWNEAKQDRDTIGVTHFPFLGTVDVWTKYTRKIGWLTSDIPDSLNIGIVAGDIYSEEGIKAGSKLWIDDVYFIYDPTTEINENNIEISAIVSPNPFKNITNIRFSSDDPGTGVFAVYSVLGNLVYKEDIEVQRGLNTLPFTPNNLSEGIYFYSLQFAGKEYSGKMNILK